MGDRLTTIDMAEKWGSVVPLSGRGQSWVPSNAMCLVTSNGQIMTMLSFPMHRHVSTSWSSWSEPAFQSGTCCTSIQCYS